MRVKVAVAASAIALVGALIAPSFAAAGVDLRAPRMSGNQIVGGPGAPNGRGGARFTLNVQQNKFCFRVHWNGIGRAEGMNIGIYTGAKGQNGREQIELVGTPRRSPQSGCIRGVSSSLLKEIRDRPRQFHINIKTQRYNRFGAIRSQLRNP